MSFICYYHIFTFRYIEFQEVLKLSNDGVGLYHAVAHCSPLNTSFVCIK